MPRTRTKPTPAFKKSWEHYNDQEMRPITESILNLVEDGQVIDSDLVRAYNADLITAEKERLKAIQEKATQRLKELEAEE